MLAGTYSSDDRRSLDQLLRKRVPDDRPNTRASLIVTLLLSLGVWAAIWGLSLHCCRRCDSLSSDLSARCLGGSVAAFSIKRPMRIHTSGRTQSRARAGASKQQRAPTRAPSPVTRLSPRDCFRPAFQAGARALDARGFASLRSETRRCRSSSPDRPTSCSLHAG